MKWTEIRQSVTRSQGRPHEAAAAILHALGMKSAPYDPYVIAEKLGVEVLHDELGYSGFATFDDRTGVATIVLALQEQKARRWFTLAHELGHLVMHPAGKMFRDDSRNMDSDSAESVEELQANLFAAALLMPLTEFRRKASEMNGNVDKLAAAFGVSRPAAANRLRQLARTGM